MVLPAMIHLHVLKMIYVTKANVRDSKLKTVASTIKIAMTIISAQLTYVLIVHVNIKWLTVV
jgi:hypothetical protein